MYRCDVSDLSDVRAFAARLAADEPRLDVLVNNAGVLPAERALSADGHELALATNVLGPFLLTNLLLGRLTASAPARVVNVSSGGMYTRRLDVDELLSADEPFDGPAAYTRAPSAPRWPHRAVGGATRRHRRRRARDAPGWADTPGVASSLPRFHG